MDEAGVLPGYQGVLVHVITGSHTLLILASMPCVIYVYESMLHYPEKQLLKGWIKEVDFPVLIHRQIFTNKDGNQVILYLVCSDLQRIASQIKMLYKKLWCNDCTLSGQMHQHPQTCLLVTFFNLRFLFTGLFSVESTNFYRMHRGLSLSKPD